MTFPMPPLPRTSWKDDETRRSARLSTEAPRVPWDRFVRDHLSQWHAGEHFALIGPTGQGKTTMLQNILPYRPYVVVFATKPRDESMEAFIRAGYARRTKWRAEPAAEVPRRVLWPDASKINSEETQREIFADALGKIYREGYWTVALDELWYVINILKMESYVKTFLLQGRSLGISLVAATQRPAFVPLEVYDQSTHLMFWRDNDETNLRRLSGISWRSSDLIRGVVADLDRFQVLYINTRTGEMLRTRCPFIPSNGGR